MTVCNEQEISESYKREHDVGNRKWVKPEEGEAADFDCNLRQEERLALLAHLLQILEFVELSRDVSSAPLLVRLCLLGLLRHAVDLDTAVAVPLSDVELASELRYREWHSVSYKSAIIIQTGTLKFRTYNQCRVVLCVTHQVLQQSLL